MGATAGRRRRGRWGLGPGEDDLLSRECRRYSDVGYERVVVMYASPGDTQRFGESSIRREPGDERPPYRFEGRISTDGSTPFAAESGRYHIYSGWFCPWAQRVVIAHALAGLQDVISVSYVDNRRDGRGWGF